MNKQLRNIGIATLVAGALVYPAMKLYQYIAKRRAEMDNDDDAEKAPKKKMRLLNHTKHVPHHPVHNGHANPSVG